MATVECAAPFAHILQVSAVPVAGGDGEDDAGGGGKGGSGLAVDRLRLNVSW
jgi:hypothetical protein